MLATRVLLVDGDEVVHMTLAGVPEQSGFAITSAANARESLGLIAGGESYDALLSDRHLPGSGSGDALTVVSGMRHANPGAVTLLRNAFPVMTVASFPQQTDETVVKAAEVT